jgi:TonB family protein
MPADVYETIGRARPRGLRDPVVVRGILPSYDDRAMRAKTQGDVMVEVVILSDGTVGDARVTRSLDEGLDREALIAARHWLFQPATRDGQPVACRSVLMLTFQLR